MKKKVCVCASCSCEAECAWNNWCLYDSNNPECPNYAEGKKMEKIYEEQELRDLQCLGYLDI